jgi:hypothetical protein
MSLNNSLQVFLFHLINQSLRESKLPLFKGVQQGNGTGRRSGLRGVQGSDFSVATWQLRGVVVEAINDG